MKYQILVADPPWCYRDQKNNDPRMGGITYKIMKDEDIYSLPVNEIADKDSILFMWATMPKLPEALETIKRWGFSYTTCAFCWVKQNPKNDNFYSGLGHWVNGNIELCLLAKKGHPKRIAKNIKQIVLAHRREHSRKPDEVADRIVKLMGDLPRIELFATHQTKGWTCLGFDIDNKDIRDSLNEIIKSNESINTN